MSALSEVIIRRLRNPARVRHFRNSCQLVRSMTSSWARRNSSNWTARRFGGYVTGFKVLAPENVVYVL